MFWKFREGVKWPKKLNSTAWKFEGEEGGVGALEQYKRDTWALGDSNTGQETAKDISFVAPLSFPTSAPLLFEGIFHLLLLQFSFKR